MTTRKFASKKFAKKPPIDMRRRGADESISRADAGKLLAKLTESENGAVRTRIHRAIHGGELPTIDAMRGRLNVGQLGAWATQTWPRHGAAIAAVLQPSYTIEIKFKDQPDHGAIHLAILPESLEAAAVQIDDLQRQLAAARAEIERKELIEEAKQAKREEKEGQKKRGRFRYW